MEEIVIKKIENGYLVTQGKKSFISTNSVKILTQLINKIIKESENKDLPPPVPTAKKLALS